MFDYTKLENWACRYMSEYKEALKVQDKQKGTYTYSSYHAAEEYEQFQAQQG